MPRMVCITLAVGCLFGIRSLVWAQHNGERLNQAQRLYDDKEYQEALLVLEDICAQDPTFADAYRLLGHVYFRLGRTDDARKAQARAVMYGRLTPDVLAQLAQIDRQQNQIAALLAGLNLRILVDPQDQRGQLAYADILASVETEDEAEIIYRSVIGAHPSQADVYLRLGNLYIQKDEHQKAISALETAYCLGDLHSSLPETIAELWFNAGDQRQALLWYERALNRQTDSGERVRLRRAELLLWAEELEKAEVAAHQLAESKNRDIADKAYLLLGQIAMRRRQPDVAVGYWEQAFDGTLDEPQILTFLGSHYFNNSQYKKAVDYLERRLTAGGADREVFRHFIISLIRSGETKRARGEMQTYIEQYGLDNNLDQLVVALLRETKDAECGPTLYKPSTVAIP